jgi:hypothetical protein
LVRLLLKLSLFLPIVVGVACVNWQVDPARVFDRHAFDPRWFKYERFLARSLASGQPQPLAAVHNELILDTLLFRNFDRLDVLALGSSTAKPIHKELYGGQSFFNASVLGARLEEMIALGELARESGLRPRLAVLAIEPVKLQARTAPLTPGIAPLVERARARLHVPAESQPGGPWAASAAWLAPRIGEQAASDIDSLLTQYDTLFSPSYCQYCLRLVLESMRMSEGGENFVAQFGPQNRNLLYPDGSLQWCEVFLVQSPEDIRRSTSKVPTEQITAESVRPTAERRTLFEAFVRDLLDSGTKVEFFLPPPNPWLYAEAQAELQKLGRSSPTAETEAYLRRFAQEHDIRVRGSYDPQRAGVTESDFVDLVHLRRESLDQIWNGAPASRAK